MSFWPDRQYKTKVSASIYNHRAHVGGASMRQSCPCSDLRRKYPLKCSTAHSTAPQSNSGAQNKTLTNAVSVTWGDEINSRQYFSCETNENELQPDIVDSGRKVHKIPRKIAHPKLVGFRYLFHAIALPIDKKRI